MSSVLQRTQIYLPKKQRDSLRKEAHRRRVSVSHVIRDIIFERFDTVPMHVNVPKHETLVEASKRIGRMGKKAPKDLATRMDHYLYGGK